MTFTPAPRLTFTKADRETAIRLAGRLANVETLSEMTAKETASAFWAIWTLGRPERDEIAEVVTKARAIAERHLPQY